MKADSLCRFGADYDLWKTSDPADDLPDLPEVTEERAESLAECVINHMGEKELIQRLKEYYEDNEAQYQHDWADYERQFEEWR